MKYVASISAASVLLVGCYVSQSAVGVLSWENSNPVLIEKSLPINQILQELDSEVDLSESLVIWNEEQRITTDNSITASFEGALIRSLLNEGYQLLERDQDLIYRMLAESGDGFIQINPEKNWSTGSALSAESSGSSAYLGGYSSGYSSSRGIGGSEYYDKKNWVYKDSTSLNTAKKALSYRIVECGIVIEEEQSDFGYIERVIREARTVIDLKVLDVTTGSILSASRVTQAVRDTLSGETYDEYKDRTYRNYHYTYPVVNGNPRQQKVTKEDPPTKKSRNGW